MRRSIHFILLSFVFCFVVPSCKYSTEYQVINAANKFSLSIPPWMKKVDDLKPDAEFQYANRFRNFYAIGMAGAKSKPISETMNFNLNVLRKSLSNPVVSDSVSINITGLNATRCEIYGKMNTENIYFTEVLIEGKSNIYHLSIWTRGEDRKLRYKEDINQIIRSFKEL